MITLALVLMIALVLTLMIIAVRNARERYNEILYEASLYIPMMGKLQSGSMFGDSEFEWIGMYTFSTNLDELISWWPGDVQITAGKEAYAKIYKELFDFGAAHEDEMFLGGILVEKLDPEDSLLCPEYFSIIPVVHDKQKN